MRRSGTDPAKVALAATDLSNHLACPHLTTLDRDAALGRIDPPYARRPGLDALRERGFRHERAYLEHLAVRGLRAVSAGDDDTHGIEWTREAMRARADVIVQAPLGDEGFRGRADVLLRVERPSALGDWSYEPVDTKLARETRAGSILQLALYAELLEPLQGVRPELMHVVSPHAEYRPQSFRVDDYRAYSRWVRRRLEAAVERSDDTAPYPDPVPHCDLCRWWSRCDRKRRTDDHLSLVAGISRLQRRELESRDVATLAGLAELSMPLPWTPRRGARQGFERVREQARVQLEGRRAGKRAFELLDLAPGQGLARLPEPGRGDLFLDLEGDPYVGEHGLEYLFGLAFLGEGGEPVYVCEWATTPDEEKAAFEHVVDIILIHWDEDPDLHVYHYGAYDPSALKRLMGRYATREREVDRLLRAGRFVDLLPVVRQSLRASVERYSIKDLEPFFGFERKMELRQAAAHRAAIEQALELGDPESIAEEDRLAVESYNRDDCVSALWLRDWLEGLRADRVANGADLARPVAPESGEPNPELDERETRTRALAERLRAGAPADPSARTPEQRAQALLADLLEWHRREEKTPWWEYFRLRDLSDEELLEERAGIAGLEFVGMVESGRRKLERYTFPPQETSVREGDPLHSRFGKVGDVVAIHLANGILDLRRAKNGGPAPSAAFRHKLIPGTEQAEALFRIGSWVAQHGVDAPGRYRAGRDLLLGLAPRLVPGASLEGEDDSVVHAARRLALELDRGTLVIQGPPGAGKTYTSARMICDLVRVGRRVGVSAQSHKVIRNLLQAVVEAAVESGSSVSCLHKVTEKSEESPIPETTENDKVARALRDGQAQIVGGTPWLWSREEFHEAVDVLFVDEAGQMSLANALASSQGAKSLVLVGDPQQLEQPIQGTHPGGAEVSALEHVLGGGKTLPAGRGLFLDETWRLHPAICAFTSEQFYEGRLRARDGLERQSIQSAALSGAGLWFAPVEHEGNTTSSAEEVAVVRALLEDLTDGASAWIDGSGDHVGLGLEDVLVVAPYNAQVADLIRVLPYGARVGTVDRFQGQEAAVVIVSMTTSAPEDAPRGMEFLYSLDRLNVATSRARAACVLVASPRLFEPECRSPRQMQLANAFCRYLELATLLRRSITPSTA